MVLITSFWQHHSLHKSIDMVCASLRDANSRAENERQSLRDYQESLRILQVVCGPVRNNTEVHRQP